MFLLGEVAMKRIIRSSQFLTQSVGSTDVDEGVPGCKLGLPKLMFNLGFLSEKIVCLGKHTFVGDGFLTATLALLDLYTDCEDYTALLLDTITKFLLTEAAAITELGLVGETTFDYC